MGRPGVDFPGVGCGLVIQRADGRVLLCKRMKAPEAGHWNIVGGKVDQGERSADAARREAEEESGLTIGAVDFLCWTEEIIATDGQHWLSLIYVTRDFAGEPRPSAPARGRLPEKSATKKMSPRCWQNTVPPVMATRPRKVACESTRKYRCSREGIRGSPRFNRARVPRVS